MSAISVAYALRKPRPFDRRTRNQENIFVRAAQKLSAVSGSRGREKRELFSGLCAVLEPQSRGVLIRETPESLDASGGCRRFALVGGRRSTDEAAFLRPSTDIERS